MMIQRNFSTIFQLVGCVILGSLVIGCTTQPPVSVAPTEVETTPTQQIATETPMPTATPIAEAPSIVTPEPEEAASIFDAVDQYFNAVAQNDIGMYIDAFSEDTELVVVGRTFNGHSGIEQFGSNEVLGGEYVILAQKQISEDNVKILLEFTPRGWSNPEPQAVYDFTVEDNKIVRANLQYATQEDIDELTETQTAATPVDDNIPAPFQCYLDGVEAQNLAATTACFAEGALVVDVGREIAGRDAINRWLDNEVMGLIYEVESSTITQEGASIIVNIRFGSGSSGFRARYDIAIEDGLIQEMILRYA